MSMNDRPVPASVTDGRWVLRYTVLGELFADGAATRMPVTSVIHADPHGRFAEIAAIPHAVHITLTDSDGVIVETARCETEMPPEAQTYTQLAGYGFNEYDQVTHTDGSVWYVRSITGRSFPNGERALVAVNVTQNVDGGLCQTFTPNHLIVTGDGAHSRQVCRHGHQRNRHDAVADADDITLCCTVPVGVTGDGYRHCRCCWSEITGGHETELIRIDL